MSVLLVEDDDQDARLLDASLCNEPDAVDLGFTRVRTLSGAQRLLAQQSFDAALLDLGLPDSEGLSTFRRLARTAPSLPVVVLSGDADQELGVRAVSEGAHDFLVKGRVTGDAVVRVLRYARERAQALERERQVARRQALALDVGRVVLSEADPGAVFAEAAAALRAGLALDRTEVLIDSDVALPDGAFGPGEVLDVGELARPHRRFLAALLGCSQPAGGVVLPVTGLHGSRGLVAVLSSTPRKFEQDELAFASQIAALVGTATRRWRIEEARDAANRQLAASEQRLRVLLDQLPAVVYTLDTDLRPTSLTGQGVKASGPPLHPFMGREIQDVLRVCAREGTGRVVAAHHNALSGDAGTFTVEASGRWWEGYVEPLKDGQGRVAGVVGLALDRTDAIKQEQLLADSRGRLQALFDHSLDAILLVDDEGRLVDVNQAGCELLDAGRSELLEMGVEDVFTRAQQDDYPPVWASLKDQGSLVTKLELRGGDHTLRVAEMRGVADIQPGLHLIVLRDITLQVDTEDALKRSEERFRQLADKASEGIFRISIGGDPCIEYVNGALASMTGIPISEPMLDLHVLMEQVHRDDRRALEAGLCRWDEERTPLQARFRRADGGWRWLDIHLTPVRDANGAVEAIQGIVVDATQRQRQHEALEQALQREQEATDQLTRLDAMKDNFLRAVSHELRTPLSVVYGNALTLRAHQERLGTEKSRDLLDRLAANADRLRALLDDLLDVTRLSSGKLELRLEAVDLSDVVAGVLDQVEAPAHGISSDLVPTDARVERPMFERIVSNLVHNALKHTPTGTNIHVSCRATEGGALLTVKDDGPGVPDDLKASIFEPFYQGPESSTSANPGTGIGLSLVSRFAELHGGRAWVDDAPSGGASFHVLLPPITGRP